MGLRIEEDLGVPHIVRGSAAQIRGGHLVEVALRAQDAGSLVVNIEERLQIGEGVGAAQLIDRSKAKTDAVPPRDVEHQLRFQRAFDVNMQLRFGDAADELFQRHQCGRPKT